MKQALIGLTLAISLTAGGARAEDDPDTHYTKLIGRYTTIAVGEDQIVVTDTQRGRLRVCKITPSSSTLETLPVELACSRWKSILAW